jgi:hypothetical protein
MAKNSQPASVRPMEVSDFQFIRRLASTQFQFTRPPYYVLWLLKRTNSQFCMVVDPKRLGPVAYMLSLPVSNTRNKHLYVWQLAATPQGHQKGAIHLLLLALRKLVRRKGVRSLSFTTVPGSKEYRVIRRYANTLSGAAPRSQVRLPSIVSRNEHEFVIRVK